MVALETAVTTTGLPRHPLDGAPPGEAPGWDPAGPVNLETARLMERVIRTGGAVPATVAVLGGTLHVGLDDEELRRLAGSEDAAKTSAPDLAGAMASGGDAGTTVSATLLACRRVEAGPIRVMATGGIGGVHRGWPGIPDVSADLRQLALTPACVVAAGPKSVLDGRATLEALETLGVAVIGYRTNRLPRFHTAADDDLAVPARLDDVEAVARWCRTQWSVLGIQAGVLLANPIPPDAALEASEVEAAVAAAEDLAATRGITGRQRTPFLLAEMSRRLGPRSVEANIVLLAGNARLAGALAVAIISSAP